MNLFHTQKYQIIDSLTENNIKVFKNFELYFIKSPVRLKKMTINLSLNNKHYFSVNQTFNLR